MSAEQPASPDAGSSGTKRFGKYDIQRQLGAGGMGIVYLAVDRELRRTVALKILSKERAENPLLVKRFKAEGQTAAHLQHPNIVHVYESGEIDNYLYLALEYVDGVDLLEWQRKRGVLPVRRSIDIIRQVTEALGHAAEKQIVHRDIKPSNIMIRADGTAKLADMGLARFVDESDDTSITRAGTTVGTVDYMAPEQAQDSKSADIRSDIYSLGCAWFHMLTGAPPYPEGSVTNKLRAHASGALPDPRSLNSNVPEGVVAVIHRMLAKRPEDRYQTPAELLEDLKNPLLSRGGLAPDIFAALAMDAPSPDASDTDFVMPSKSPPGSTPLSIGSTATRADWDPDIDIDDSERGAGESDAGEQDAGESVPSSPARSQQKPEQPAPRPGKPNRSQAAERETPEVLDGSPPLEAKPSRSNKRQQAKGRADASSSRAKTRSAATSSGRTRSEGPVTSKTSRKTREKAAATGNAGSNNGLGIAIDFQKVGTWLAVAVLLLGVAWWVLTQLPYWFSEGEGVAANPYATQMSPATPSDPEQNERAAEVMPENGEPQPTADSQNAAGTEPDFPGMDEIGLGKETIDEFLPDWLRAGWGQPASSELQATLIDPYGTTPNSHRTAAAALEGSSGKDLILEFVDAGPHQMAATAMTPAVGSPVRTVTLRAATGQRTTLLVDADDPEQRRWLSVEKGLLKLERLDVLILSRGLRPELPAFQLLELQSSDLMAHDCSFTVIVPAEATGTISGNAIHVSGVSPTKNRVLLENCSFHLRELSCVGVDANSCDILLGNCLLDSTSAASIRLAAPQPESSPIASNLRRVALLACSTVSDGPLLTAAQSEVAPLPLELRVRRSLMVGRNNAAPWIELQDWPLATAAKIEAPAAQDVTLKCEHVRFINRPRLTSLVPPKGAAMRIEDTTAWRQFWKQPLPSDDWINRPDVTFAAHQLIRSKDLAARFPDELQPGIGARALLGVDAALIPEVPEDVELRTLTGLTRIRPPEDFGQPPAKGKSVRFDLKRANTFQEFLNSPECPSGTTITCFGIGLKSLPPVVIRGKKLRIVFEQDQEGAGLVVQPVADANADAWFRVENGQLDLINAPLKIPTSRTRKYPQVILKLQESEASIQHCQLLGPEEVQSQSALIDVQSESDAHRFITISDSFLSSPGTLLRVGNAEVECSNSVFCSYRSAIEMSEAASRGNLLFFHCTFSSGAVLDISRLNGLEDGPRNVFLRNSIFLPAPSAADPASGYGGNTVVLDSAGEVLPGRMQWWEANCGYAPQVLHWITADTSNTAQTLASDRRRMLTPAQKYREVLGQNGVLLKGPLPKRVDLQPEHFQLMATCDAATRSLDGGPLGIRLPIGPDLTPTAKSPGTPGKLAPPKGTPQKGPFRPDF